MAFGPRILTGFSGWCPGIRKISKKKPQKDLTFACTCGIISVTVEDGLNRKTGKEKGYAREANGDPPQQIGIRNSHQA